MHAKSAFGVISRSGLSAGMFTALDWVSSCNCLALQLPLMPRPCRMAGSIVSYPRTAQECPFAATFDI